MNSTRRNVFLHGFLAVSLSLAFSAAPAAAQTKAQKTPQIIGIAVDLEKDVGAPTKEVDLRPNTPTELGFELRNNAGEILGDVKLKVVQVLAGGERVLAEAAIPKLEPTPANAKGMLIQKFDKVKGAPEKLELAGAPPFNLQIQVQGKNLPLVKRVMKLNVREPKDYVAPTVKFNPNENSLSVEVAPKGENTFIGLHSLPVRLVLGPDLRPSKKGIFKQTLTGVNQKLPLVADEIAFERKLTEGDVYLKVDGYDRAFTYSVKENSSGAIEARPAGEIRVRIGAPRYAKPIAKFDVPLEIDGPISGEYKVRVGLDRTGDTDIEDMPASDLREYVGLRQQKLVFSVSPEGELICQPEVRDWTPQFDTADIFGRNVKIRVAVVKDKDKMKIAVAPESRPEFARTESDDREKEIKSVFAQITVDDSVPEGLTLDLPKDKEGTVGEPFEIKTGIKDRKSTQAPIARVIVFRGKGPKTDKEEIKADDIIMVEEVTDPKIKDWKLKLPAHTEKGLLALSVQFVTKTGAKATITDAMTFSPATVAKKLYKIKGRVVRGELGQPGLKVTLLDAKGNVKGMADTNDKGAFTFENVEPGTYVISSQMAVQNLLGITPPINVPDKGKKELNVTVSLLRK